MGVIEVWTLVAIILHFAGIENFKDWPVIDWPTSWSCMCLELWVILFYVVLIGGCILMAYLSSKKNKF